MADKEKIETKMLRTNEVAKKVRVMINQRGALKGKLATIVYVYITGCGCSSNYCTVKIDGGGKEDFYFEHSDRHVDDLLLVVKEPERVENKKSDQAVSGKLVSPETVMEGLVVSISPHSKFSHQNSGKGEIVEIDVVSHGWARVEFENGYANDYRYGVDGESDLVIV